MIKFFRKIRYNLISGNKTGKYIKYAVGEIILVVIGILIALQINNWNNEKQNSKKESFLLKEIRNNLQENLMVEIIPAIEDYEVRLKSYSRLDTKFYSSSENLPQGTVKSLILKVISEWELLLNEVAFENLKSSGLDLITNDTLRTQISTIYEYYFNNLMSHEKRTQKFFSEQMEPAFHREIKHWKSPKTKTELESIRRNTYLASVLNSRNLNRRKKLNWLKITQPKIEELIRNIDQEIQRLN